MTHVPRYESDSGGHESPAREIQRDGIGDGQDIEKDDGGDLSGYF